MSKVVYIFKKDGCPPCERLLPFIQKIGSHYMHNEKVPQRNKVMTKIIDIHDSNGMALAAAYGVNATPTVIFLLNNEVVGRIDGGDQEKIERFYYERLSTV